MGGTASKIGKKIGEGIADAAEEVGEEVVDAANKFGVVIGKPIAEFGAAIGNEIADGVTDLTDDIGIPAVFDGAVSGLAKGLNAGADWISDPEFPSPGDIIDGAKITANALADVGEDFGNAIGDGAEVAWSGISEVGGEVVDGAVDFYNFTDNMAKGMAAQMAGDREVPEGANQEGDHGPSGIIDKAVCDGLTYYKWNDHDKLCQFHKKQDDPEWTTPNPYDEDGKPLTEFEAAMFECASQAGQVLLEQRVPSESLIKITLTPIKALPGLPLNSVMTVVTPSLIVLIPTLILLIPLIQYLISQIGIEFLRRMLIKLNINKIAAPPDNVW